MEEYRTDSHVMCGRNRVWKYLGLILATLVGAFLAFYFAISCTISYLMSPAYAMRQADRIAMSTFNESGVNQNKMFMHKSAVEYIKTPDAYKFIIDLTPFQGKTDDISVDIKDNQISISGEASSNSKHMETFTKMSQTYSLCKGANIEKMSKKTVDNKYIITIPIED